MLTIHPGVDILVPDGNYQPAIDRAIAAYRDKYGKEPTLVALPRRVDASRLNLRGMMLGTIPSGSDGVMVFGND